MLCNPHGAFAIVHADRHSTKLANEGCFSGRRYLKIRELLNVVARKLTFSPHVEVLAVANFTDKCRVFAK